MWPCSRGGVGAGHRSETANAFIPSDGDKDRRGTATRRFAEDSVRPSKPTTRGASSGRGLKDGRERVWEEGQAPWQEEGRAELRRRGGRHGRERAGAWRAREPHVTCLQGQHPRGHAIRRCCSVGHKWEPAWTLGGHLMMVAHGHPGDGGRGPEGVRVETRKANRTLTRGLDTEK